MLSHAQGRNVGKFKSSVGFELYKEDQDGTGDAAFLALHDTQSNALYLSHSCPAARCPPTFPQTQEHLLTDQRTGILLVASLGFQL